MAKQAEEFMDKMFDEMSPEEMTEFIRGLRHSRITPKATSKRGKQAKKASVKRVDKTKELLDKLSPEQREALLAELLEEGNE